MKKNLLFAIAVSVIAVSSCKKSPKEEAPENPFDIEYSNLDTTAQKENLESKINEDDDPYA